MRDRSVVVGDIVIGDIVVSVVVGGVVVRGGRRWKKVDDVDAVFCVDVSTPTCRRVDAMRALIITLSSDKKIEKADS